VYLALDIKGGYKIPKRVVVLYHPRFADHSQNPLLVQLRSIKGLSTSISFDLVLNIGLCINPYLAPCHARATIHGREKEPGVFM
jgi:hypothetical protein